MPNNTGLLSRLCLYKREQPNIKRPTRVALVSGVCYVNAQLFFLKIRDISTVMPETETSAS